MKNIILIHGIGGLHRESYFPHLKEYCEKIGLNTYMHSFGGYRDETTYEKWKEQFDEMFLGLLNKDTIIVSQSIGTQFIVKYLAENKKEVGCYISVAGPIDATCFRASIAESAKRFETAAKTFIPNSDEYEKFKNLNFPKYSFYSDNDCFFEIATLEEYVRAIGSTPKFLPNKNHFNEDGGVIEFSELESFIKSLV